MNTTEFDIDSLFDWGKIAECVMQDHWLIKDGQKIVRVTDLENYKWYFPDWFTIPKQGIYFLFSKGEIVYIGMSMSMKKRLKNHSVNRDRNNLKEWDGFCFIDMEGYTRGQIVDIEEKSIRHYKPKYNKQYLK